MLRTNKEQTIYITMISSFPLLTRHPAQTAPALSLLSCSDELSLVEGRVHEACGLSRHTFAMWIAAKTQGTVIWIAPAWTKDKLSSDGVSQWINPARLLFVTPKRGEDILWTIEEVLRSGAVSLVVADMPDIPGLTQIRRMQLAAETGGQARQVRPTGLLLTPGKGGAAGVETRWHMSPRQGHGQTSWHLERLRARTQPQKSWEIVRLSEDAAPQIKSA